MQKLLFSFISLLIFSFSANPVKAAVIEFWTTETQSDRVKTIQLLMDTFQALNPGTTVKLIPMDENQLPSQVAAASAAGIMPYIIEAGMEFILSLADEGILDIPNTTELVTKIGNERFYKVQET